MIVRSPGAAARFDLARFPPGSFAFVMATGIVSIAAHDQGIERVAHGLFWLNGAAYLVLWVLTLLRLARHRAEIVGDLTSHARGAAFLTMVAGTCVLGSQFAILTPSTGAARGFWFVGIALWLGLCYAFFTVMSVRAPKPTLEEGIRGSWLLVIVSTEAVSVLGTLVARSVGAAEVVLFFSLCAFLAGAMFYVFFVTLILYRWMFFPLSPERLTPDYWIDMGAVAISTLAGSLLLSAAPASPLLAGLTHFLTGLTLLFWAAATWWIPLLAILEIWRHVRGKVPLTYDPDYWSLVFPLGMYASATSKVVHVTGLTFLSGIARGFAYVALLAWCVTFLGMVHALVRPGARA